MGLHERFFGPNNRSILYELGLKPEKDESLIYAIAERVVNYAGRTLKDVSPGDTFVHSLFRWMTPEVKSQACLTNARPRYLRHSSHSRSRHLLTIQLIRQSVYPSWLSSPYPGGSLSSIAPIALDRSCLDQAIGLSMPLFIELSEPATLPGTEQTLRSVTDTELVTLRKWPGIGERELEHVNTCEILVAPRQVIPASIYQQLDPAWGLYLEGVVRIACHIENGRISLRGRHLQALELAQLHPMLELLEQDERFRVYGWGSGRIHFGTDVDPSHEMEDLLYLCAENSAYVFSKNSVYMRIPRGEKETFCEAYRRLIESASPRQVESILKL